MTEQDEQADPHREAAEHRGVDQIQLGEAHPLRGQLGEQRHQRHRTDRAQGELPAHAPDRQGVERQVEQEERRAERPAGQVLEQEGQPHGAAGEQPGMGVERDAKGHQRRAGEQRQGILPERMADEDRRYAPGWRYVGFAGLHRMGLAMMAAQG
ncbi:hypothetical protein D3C77_599040 [compost metagenome]